MRAAVRAARTRAAHLLLRMSPGHSRCASIASPAQRGRPALRNIVGEEVAATLRTSKIRLGGSFLV